MANKKKTVLASALHKRKTKKDEEKNTITLNAYVIDYVGKPKIDGKKVEIRMRTKRIFD